MKILSKTNSEFKKLKEKDDFFPYRDNKGDYWTGYFTTYPYLKKFTMDNGRLL